ARRGKIFTRIIKEISIAARISGGDPDGNPRLRTAILAAKSANMPQDNITRAIKKGTGELEGVNFEEITFEAYGPGGAAILINVTTDNRNRTVSELRHLLSRGGGNMAEAGSVSWVFKKMGLIEVNDTEISEDELMELVLDAGADDVEHEEEIYEIKVLPENFEPVRQALEQKSFPILRSDLTMIPKNTVKLEGRQAEQILKLMETIEDHEDVDNVYSNFDIPAEIMERMSV
ncbi:MAG: transcriptional regulator, partial [Candidatus Schekmanbacteria bacterium RBG_13_48_7]